MPIGLVIIVIGVIMTGIGFWRQVRTPVLLHATEGPADPRVSALQSENTDLKQKLTAAERQAEESRQRSAAPQAPPMPRMPGEPLPPRNPYPDGPIFRRDFVGDNERQQIIDGMRDLSKLAIEIQNDLDIPRELIMRRRFGIADPSKPQNFAQVVAQDGYDVTVDSLERLIDKTKAYSEKIIQIASRDPYFSSDLFRVLGNTGLNDLDVALQRYVSGLLVLKRSNVAPKKDNSEIIFLVLNDAESSLEQANVDYRKWVSSFVSEREPQARALLTGSRK